MKRLFLTLIFLNGCVTSPDSSQELQKRIDADLIDQKLGEVDLAQGRPLFQEVQSYPQILSSGDLWLGGTMLVNIGREQLQLSDFMRQYKSQKSD